MIWGANKGSYEDPIFQISSLYLIWFDLQTLLKLTENKEEKTPKKTKNSHKYVKTQNFKKQKKKSFLGFTARVPHTKNQLPATKTVTCSADTDRHTRTHAHRDCKNRRTYRNFFGLIFSWYLYRLAVQQARRTIMDSFCFFLISSGLIKTFFAEKPN